MLIAKYIDYDCIDNAQKHTNVLHYVKCQMLEYTNGSRLKTNWKPEFFFFNDWQ